MYMYKKRRESVRERTEALELVEGLEMDEILALSAFLTRQVGSQDLWLTVPQGYEVSVSLLLEGDIPR